MIKAKGKRCPRCEGKGYILHPGLIGMFHDWKSKCDLCGGSGKVNR